MTTLYKDYIPDIKENDLKIIATPTDFLGINYYMPQITKASSKKPLLFEADDDKKAQHTDMGWVVYPNGLFELLERVTNDYKIPEIYIVENGAAYKDRIESNGEILDGERKAYIREHLFAILKSIQQNNPVKGYFVWSLLDNFEWSFGYSKRFGIVYVDHESQKRTVKESGKWFSKVVRSREITG